MPKKLPILIRIAPPYPIPYSLRIEGPNSPRNLRVPGQIGARIHTRRKATAGGGGKSLLRPAPSLFPLRPVRFDQNQIRTRFVYAQTQLKHGQNGLCRGDLKKRETRK